MATLTRDQLLDMHTYIVQRYGGRFGITSNDTLETVIATPHQVLFGAHRYPGAIAQMSALVYALVKRAPFQSHNDTTALLALLWLCHHNGFHTSFVQRELADQLQAIHRATDDTSFYAWLCDVLQSPDTPQP
jgi:death-on-curing protein